MLVSLLTIICVALVLSVALGEGIPSLSHSDLPDSSDYAHYWKIRHKAPKPEPVKPAEED